MTKDEEEREKARVSHLSPDEKDAELRKLNREIARLETLKGINTGELYTWTGRYKALVRSFVVTTKKARREEITVEFPPSCSLRFFFSQRALTINGSSCMIFVFV